MKSRGFNAHNKYMILKHAFKENNISQTCRLFGISRTTFYNWQKAYRKHGMIGLENEEPKMPQMPNKVSKVIEQEILTYVARYPTDGPKRIYYELRSEGFDMGETGIYNVLRRHELTRKAQRVEYSMNKDLHMKINRKDNRREPVSFNIREAHPGYLVIQRIDFMGTFVGIGRIYQYSLYDTASKWGGVKLYNKRQDINIWDYFEFKLAYLLKTFNLSIENLVTEKKKDFLPYLVKGNKYKEIIADFNINHIFISPDSNTVLDEMRVFNEFIITEFYNKIGINDDLDSFIKVECGLSEFIREYNFHGVISDGSNTGRTPVEVILEKALQNDADLDTLPLWLLALINFSRRTDKDE